MIKISVRASKRVMQEMKEMERTAAAVKSMNLPPMPKWAYEPAKKERRRKNDRIKRYAKKHGLELEYHRKPWIFRRIDSRYQIAMPAGYFAKVDGIFHQLVAD